MAPLTRSLVVVIALGATCGVFPELARAQRGCLEQVPPDVRERLQQQRLSLSLRDASIPTTLRLLAQQYKLNMVVTDDVTGNITLDFFQVPARDVFQAIIDSTRLDCTAVGGGALRVSTNKRLQGEKDDRDKVESEQRRREAEVQKAQADARRAQDEASAKRAEDEARGPVREETIRLNYADAEEVAKTLQGILGLSQQAGQGVPLPQLSQLYAPSPPSQIPSEPAAPQTAPTFAPPLPADVAQKGLTVRSYRPTNSLFIRFYSRDLERIKKLIQESLDIALPQIQISAQMVITTLNALEQIGIQWGGSKVTHVGGDKIFVGQGFSQSPNTGGAVVSTTTPPPATVGNLVNLPTGLLPTIAGANPAAGLLLGLVGGNFNINLAIQALESQGKARTLAAPRAVTLENSKTIISRGFEVPFTSTPSQGVQQVQFKEALLKLDVTPRLIREEGETKIRMKVVFDNDAPDFTQNVQGNPSIFKRHQEADVVIRAGQRLVIGGVTNDVSSTTVRQVPLLGHIPVLGWLFKSREIKSDGEELIVILTPSVVSDTTVPPKR